MSLSEILTALLLEFCTFLQQIQFIEFLKIFNTVVLQ